MPTREKLCAEWGYSEREAQAFEGGYDSTRLTQEIIKGGAAQVAAEVELDARLNEQIALRQARIKLAALIWAKVRTDDSGETRGNA